MPGGSKLDTGALLFGRGTWELFSRIWPSRSDEFSARMNAAPKWVASRTPVDLSAWNNSAQLADDLIGAVQRLRRELDVIVIGSTTIVDTLRAHDLVDEYRLLVFPIVIGAGRRLFEGRATTDELRLISVHQSGAAMLLRYQGVGR